MQRSGDMGFAQGEPAGASDGVGRRSEGEKVGATLATITQSKTLPSDVITQEHPL